jgi:glycosyltransferase involved in cell wall biosynthesis
LAVGTIEPRKNYDFLLTFWEEMHSKIDGITRIVIVGKPGWKSKETQARLAYNSKLNLVWLKNSCDGSLCFFYQNARFFISTSKDEGFNLPALEARQLYGLPVILSDIPIHHEIHGKFATYFNDANELTSYLVTNNQEPKICNRSLIQIETPLRDLFDQIDRNFS